MKIMKLNKNTRFIYGTLMNEIDVDWTLDISTLSQYLQILLDIPEKFSPPPGYRHKVVSNQHHLNVLRSSVNDGSLEAANILTIVDMETMDYIDDKIKDEQLVHDIDSKFSFNYSVSYMRKEHDEIQEHANVLVSSLPHIALVEMRKETSSSMEDFPWQPLYSGFPICYEGKYIIAHKKRKTG